MNETASLYDNLLEEHDRLAPVIGMTPAGPWANLRESAWKDFQALQFPTTKEEDWKYTNIIPFLQPHYHLAGRNGVQLKATDILNLEIPDLEGWHIVLVNGVLHPELSRLPDPGEIQVCTLAEAADLPAFREHFGKYLDTTKYHFAALNTALAENGLFIEVKKNARIGAPVLITHLFTGSAPLIIQPRNLYILQPCSEVSLVENFVSLFLDEDILINAATEMYLGEGSTADHYRIQDGSLHQITINHTQVTQADSSLYNNHTYCINGRFIRNNTHVAIDAEHAETHLYGLYLTSGDQLVDNHTFVDHRKPNSRSNEWYKGVLKDQSSGVFNGKIFVRPDAQKTNAFQENNNILIGALASINSKPELEIFADDVKCSHGSTTGQLDEEAAFYLRTRGIGAATANSLLIHAFAYDVTEKIRLEPLKHYINDLIDSKLS
ncbi:MAG TPA: Fe-S cluster assembly protein SufD [Chitinophagaceae bacterium]|nr:Fe-S cluster assembly protein SufD [Chitinophagaceae bacterium]